MDFEVLKEKLNQIHILNSVRLTIGQRHPDRCQQRRGA